MTNRSFFLKNMLFNSFFFILKRKNNFEKSRILAIWDFFIYMNVPQIVLMFFVYLRVAYSIYHQLSREFLYSERSRTIRRTHHKIHSSPGRAAIFILSYAWQMERSWTCVRDNGKLVSSKLTVFREDMIINEEFCRAPTIGW